MSELRLDAFLVETRALTSELDDPADCVEAVAPLLFLLINGPRDFLKPAHSG